MTRISNLRLARLWLRVITLLLPILSISALAQSTPPLPPLSALGGDPTSVLSLIAREQRIVPAAHLQRIAVGDPSVVDVVPVKGGVLIQAKKAGVTNVTIWRTLARLSSRTKQVLADGATDVSTAQVIRVQVRAELADRMLPQSGAGVDVYGDTAVVSGQVASVPAQQSALSVAQQSSGKVIDSTTVAASPVVQVDVKVVQFQKSVLKEAGFNLFSSNSGGFGFGVFGANALTSYAPTSTGVSFGSTVGTAMSSAFNLVAGPFGNGLFANLSILETNGLARVLAQPTLVALSGQSASFLAGGEIPVPQSGGLGTTSIVYKTFGIGLTVTPTVLSANRIGLKVAPEASELDYTHALTISGTQIPAITTRRADTTVELGNGESFIIGGLVSRSTVASVNKVPMLGDLPIIGVFFKSLSYQRDDQELVIVVTPHLVKPIARGVEVPLPAAGRDGADQPVWGAFLGGGASKSELPGFSQ